MYQRKYSWTITQCQQLWEDVLRISQDEQIKAHFIGSTVSIGRGIYNDSAVPQLLVISLASH
ncbi:MAG TPA: DUF262 domain-containing protein [Sporosarcina psychrophila]|uniref:DUF262 domain-containing protein n=1 Tax=Sporosarcina psychrophila TaxID=1476 RepID=A0A921KCC7_SPOPS|nr:DUF262 domain-containing protein [Sporosarcina psychrophila]